LFTASVLVNEAGPQLVLQLQLVVLESLVPSRIVQVGVLLALLRFLRTEKKSFFGDRAPSIVSVFACSLHFEEI
jgi:hypothetical protein